MNELVTVRGRRLGTAQGLLAARGGGVTLAQGTRRLDAELRRVGAAHIAISTNVELRRDGLPRSRQRAPDDVGAAVWFALAGQPRVLACDAWWTVAENLVAIAKHIAALRGIDRWGVGTVEQAFEGHKALPAVGGTTGEQWWTVLDVEPDATAEQIERAFRAAARTAHPDAGGSEDAMARLSLARAQAIDAAGGRNLVRHEEPDTGSQRPPVRRD